MASENRELNILDGNKESELKSIKEIKNQEKIIDDSSTTTTDSEQEHNFEINELQKLNQPIETILTEVIVPTETTNETTVTESPEINDTTTFSPSLINESNKVTDLNSETSKQIVLAEATVANYIKSSGLSFLQSQYISDDSDFEDALDRSVNDLTTTKSSEYRDKITIDSSDSSTDSDVEVVNEEQKIIDLEELIGDDDDDDDEQQSSNKTKGPLRVKGEFLLEDLPPIEDLKITVPEEECVQLGKIHSIVDQLVLVEPILGTVPLDLDTVLFMDKGKTVLGEVFDVLGQIKTPLYCVRFNSNKQIKERNIEVGQNVFVAPRTDHTHFIILDNLMKVRGSDASWENDIEPSDKHRDFSDDEEEERYRRSLRMKDRSNQNESDELSKKQKMTNNENDGNSSTDNQNRYHGYTRSRGCQKQFQRGGNNRFHGRQQNNLSNRSNYYVPDSATTTAGNSWHSYYNNQQQQQQYNLNSMQQRFYTPPPTHHPAMQSSNFLPNPYALRAPFLAPNQMQQPLFPPPPPPPPPGE